MLTAEKRYNDFSSFIRERFNGRVQKVSIDAGFTCPNIEDGTAESHRRIDYNRGFN